MSHPPNQVVSVIHTVVDHSLIEYPQHPHCHIYNLHFIRFLSLP